MATNVGSWAPTTKDGKVPKQPAKFEWDPKALEEGEEGEDEQPR